MYFQVNNSFYFCTNYYSHFHRVCYKYIDSKMKKIIYFSIFLISGLFTSCSTSNLAMRQPNNHIEFYKDDFEYSPQVTGEATSVKVFMIDWARLFNGNTGDVSGESTSEQSLNISVGAQLLADPVVSVLSAVIPVLGEVSKGRVSNYALYDMMKKNPGYDVVIYPQYETKRFMIPLINSKTTVKATARLGRIK